MWLRRVLKIGGLVVLVIGAIAFAIWRMTWAAPSWYRPADVTDAAAADLAEAVENRFVEEAHKVRPDDGSWTLRVRSEQINAWLSTRMPRWLVHEQDLRWPEQLGVPQVRVTRYGIDVALLIAPGASERVVVVTIFPGVELDRLFLRFASLSLGRIAMPTHTLDDLVALAEKYGAAEVLQQPESLWLLDVLAGRDSLEPLATLADGRRVRLLGLRMGDDFIDLTLQTLPPKSDGE